MWHGLPAREVTWPGWRCLDHARERTVGPIQPREHRIVDDVDAHYERAKAAGAIIVEEPHETINREFQYCPEDLERHRWVFSRHARDLSPEDWGANLNVT